MTIWPDPWGLVRRRATGFRSLRTSAATPYSLQIRSQGNC
jgi:hypothetical protein